MGPPVTLIEFPNEPASEEGERPAARLRAHLRPGEVVLWADRPRPFGLVRDRGLVVPLWLAAIAAPLGTILLRVTTSEFVYATALAMVAGAVVVALIAIGVARRAADTVYAVTERRVIVLRDGVLPQIDEAPADRIAWIDPAVQRDGTGAVHLTLTTTDNAGRTLVLAGLADPKSVARRIVTTFGYHAPHIVDEPAPPAGGQ